MFRQWLYSLAVIFLGVLPVRGQSAKAPLTRILFVFDASGSMWGKLHGETKIRLAKEALLRMLDSLENQPNLELGLRVYGHTSHKKEKNCRDTRLEVPFGRGNHRYIRETIQKIFPRGTTPIAYSLQQAAGDFPRCNTCRNVIILITDGIEECGGDPCAVSRALQEKGVILKPFVIGLGIDSSMYSALNCIGRFVNVRSAAHLQKVLTRAITQAAHPTTLQVWLSDAAGQVRTDLAMTFYDQKNNLPRYHFIHALRNGRPDSILVEGDMTYTLQIHTLPPFEKKGIYARTGAHTDVRLTLPLATVRVRNAGQQKLPRNFFLVRPYRQDKVLAVRALGSTLELLAGKYSIEVPTLPPTVFSGVALKAGDHKTLTIPAPGRVTFIKSTASVAYLLRYRQGRFERIYTLNPQKHRETLFIQPGTYWVVWRARRNPDTESSGKIKFEVISNGVEEIKL